MAEFKQLSDLVVEGNIRASAVGQGPQGYTHLHVEADDKSRARVLMGGASDHVILAVVDRGPLATGQLAVDVMTGKDGSQLGPAGMRIGAMPLYGQEVVNAQTLTTYSGTVRFASYTGSTQPAGGMYTFGKIIPRAGVPIRSVTATFTGYSAPALGAATAPASRKIVVTTTINGDGFFITCFFPEVYTPDNRGTGDGVSWMAWGMP